MRRTFLSCPDLEIFACRHPDVSEGNSSKVKWRNYKRRGALVPAGVTKFLKPSVAGFLLQKELDYLDGAVAQPKRPFVAIVGGSKVSSHWSYRVPHQQG